MAAGFFLSLAVPCHALLNIDGSRNQIFVFGNVNISYDSNVFSDNSGRGDYMATGSFGVELKRKRGIIAVNASAKFDWLRFNEFTDQDSMNPTFTLELNKSESGRTTGALTINAYRTSRADSAVNLRTQSWNIPIGLNIKYPVNDRIYVTSATGYLQRKYSESNVLVNYKDISEAIDVFYVYSSKLDIVAGYRIRISNTSIDSSSRDHSLTVGLVNGILPKVNGTIRLGYQFRELTGAVESTYGSYTVSTSLTWLLTRKFNLSLAASRDFTTTAVGGTVDTFSIGLQAAYSFSRKIDFSAGVAHGQNRFLGGTPRRDDFISWDVGFSYRIFNEHLSIAGSYTYMKNWSSVSFSDFDRTGYSFDISSRF